MAEFLKAAATPVTRKIIALPSIADLEKQAERTGVKLSDSAKQAYNTAQHQIRQAHRRMAKAALSVIQPGEFQKIDLERRHTVRMANEKAMDEMCAFFSDDCTSGL
jgi:hypothetical protein